MNCTTTNQPTDVQTKILSLCLGILSDYLWYYSDLIFQWVLVSPAPKMPLPTSHSCHCYTPGPGATWFSWLCFLSIAFSFAPSMILSSECFQNGLSEVEICSCLKLNCQHVIWFLPASLAFLSPLSLCPVTLVFSLFLEHGKLTLFEGLCFCRIFSESSFFWSLHVPSHYLSSNSEIWISEGD